MDSSEDREAESSSSSRNWDELFHLFAEAIASDNDARKIQAMINLAKMSKYAPESILGCTVPLLLDLLRSSDTNTSSDLPPILIRTRFPGQTATAITKFQIDNNVISLDGQDPLCTDSEMDDNGRIRVRIRQSTSSAPASSSMGLTSLGIKISPTQKSSPSTRQTNSGSGTGPLARDSEKDYI